MINLFPKMALKKNAGALTIIITVVLIVATTLIILFAASYNALQQKTSGNTNRNSQAFEAAEAGLEYGIQYLQQNSATILASPVSGFIPNYTSASTTNVTLANNSKFSIVYTNPVANNYNLILITSTGTSDDGTATRVVSQQVEFGSLLLNTPTFPVISKGNVNLSGNAFVKNTTSGTTIESGSSVSISGSADTILSSGVSSTSSSMKSDIQQNNSTIANQSNADFFETFFGVPSSIAKNSFAHYYTNSSSTSYNSLINGMTGTSIWIDQTGGTATLSGNITIGSAAAPVLIVINGNFTVSGNVTIYGLIYVTGDASTNTDITGSVSVTGGIISGDNLTMQGSTSSTFSPSVFTNLQSQSSMLYYAKVPGSWKDF